MVGVTIPIVGACVSSFRGIVKEAAKLGPDVGWALDAPPVGLKVGHVVGVAGLIVGACIFPVGRTLGPAVGSAVSFSVGAKVGSAAGPCVGHAVGPEVGENVGSTVSMFAIAIVGLSLRRFLVCSSVGA